MVFAPVGTAPTIDGFPNVTTDTGYRLPAAGCGPPAVAGRRAVGGSPVKRMMGGVH